MLMRGNNQPTGSSVMLLGSFGRGNVGDDALLIASYNLLSDHRVIANISSDAPIPSHVALKVQKLDTNLKTDPVGKIKALMAAKAIVYGGGGLWVELKGQKFPRQSLWKMAIVNFSARCLGKRVLYIGTSSGKLKGLSLNLAKISAHLANSVIVRDEATSKILNLSDAIIAPDLSITLFPHEPKRAQLDASRPIHVVISVMYYIPEPEKNFDTYLQGIASCVIELRSKNYEVTLLPMLSAKETDKNDKWVCWELLDMLPDTYNVKIAEIKSFSECLEVLGTADIIIGTRLHTSILGTWLGKPAIGIAYRPKVQRFFDENDMSESCITIFELDKLLGKIHEVTKRYEYYSEKANTAWRQNSLKADRYTNFVRANP